MKIDSVSVIYFSPTGTTEKIAKAVCEGIFGDAIETKEYNFTVAKAPVEITFKNTDLVIVAVPVYCGRCAPLSLMRLCNIKGENTPVIAITVYGNRDYDDALLELTDFLKEKNFVTFAAGAFIGEHSYTRKDFQIAMGRPSAEDMSKAKDFGLKSFELLQKIASFQDLSEQANSLTIKGKRPYQPFPTSSASVIPAVDESLCNKCGTCVNYCPTEAISINENGVITTIPEKCIKCSACIKACPQEARSLEPSDFVKRLLLRVASEPKEPEFFY